MQEMLLVFMMYCIQSDNCIATPVSPAETYWYICDTRREPVVADIPFIFDGKVITIKRDCTGA